MTLALNPPPSSPRATPGDTAAAPAGAPADNVTPDTTQPTPDTAAPDTPPTAGFQQALQQAGAQDDASPSTEADATLEALDLARWLSGQSAAATTTATATDPAPADAPQDGNDGTAQASTQDSPALRMDWTNLPVAMAASLVVHAAPHVAIRTDATASAASSPPAPHSPTAVPEMTARNARPSLRATEALATPNLEAAPTSAKPAASDSRVIGTEPVTTVVVHLFDGHTSVPNPPPSTASSISNGNTQPRQPLDAALTAAPPAAADSSSPVRAHNPQALTVPSAPLSPATEGHGDTDGSSVSVTSSTPNSPTLPWRPLDAASTAAIPTVADSSPPVQAHTPQALRETLGERLSWQVDQRSEQATIRLSPERLGHIDIQIRHEAGGLQVQLAASHSEVARQLQQVSDGLRQDLGQRHGGEVSVQVAERRDNAGLGDGGGRQQQGRSPDQQRPGRALAEADQEAESTFTFA